MNTKNLQQIPATGSKYAKIIKSCFKAPPGKLLIGLDFEALEDHISALTTKDPNKLKVYIGLKKYTLTINGKSHTILEDTIVNYDGKQMTGAELYELLQGSKS